MIADGRAPADAAPAANRYRDTLVRRRCAPATRASEVRVAGLGPPPPRPRRPDLHRPARPLGPRCSSSSTPRRAEAHAAAHELRSEAVRQRRAARLVARDAENVNPELATGEIELAVERARAARRRSPTPPFPIDEDVAVDETLRLRHRALDLRREPLRDALDAAPPRRREIRAVLERRDFLEIETPILTRSTPGGRARLPRPVAPAAGLVLRAAAVAAALQAHARNRHTPGVGRATVADFPAGGRQHAAHHRRWTRSGIPAARPLVRLLAAQLWGVAPTDPAAFLAAFAVLAAAAGLASFGPLRRSIRLTPMRALSGRATAP